MSQTFSTVPCFAPLEVMSVCKPYLRFPPAAARASIGSFYPDEVASLYGWANLGLKAQRPARVGIVELGGGYLPADVTGFVKGRPVPVPAISNLSVRGASNSPGDLSGANVEVGLDYQVVAAAASLVTGLPTQIVFAWCPNDDNGMADGLGALWQANVDTASISWGAMERAWSAAGRAATAKQIDAGNALGKPTCVAAGDNDASDGGSGLNFDFPGSYPGAICVGGTTITGTRPLAQSVWNDGQGDGTGGGVSVYYRRPSWQDGFHTNPMRAGPDVAFNADPATGYKTLVQSQWGDVGGTSAAAPLMAGFLAGLAACGISLAGMPGKLYGLPAGCFYDVLTGTNDN